MQRNHKDYEHWWYILLLYFALSSLSLAAQSPSLGSQYLKATPVLLTDGEASALFSRHTDATKPSTKRHKYTRKVVEMTTPMGHVVRTEVFSASPNKILAIITMPGMGTQKSGWDGKVAWSLTPHVGAAILDSAALERLKALAQLGPGVAHSSGSRTNRQGVLRRPGHAGWPRDEGHTHRHLKR
jgi:hypothetical protein